MSEDSAPVSVTFKVKTSSDGNHTITMPETSTVLDLKTKLAGNDFENIPTERQRLIYSGRVMKNEEPLATYKIKAGNTIHMVKSAASNAAQAPPTPAAAGAAAGVPTNMAAGTANNPLAGLTGARYAGHMGLPGMEMFGADGGMGAPPDEDAMASLLDNPNMQQSINEALNNPAMIDMMIQQTPSLRDNPNAREMLQSPEFRAMMTNPAALRQAAQLRRAMGGAGGPNAFPAPGVTDTTEGAQAEDGRAQRNAFQPNPFALPFPSGGGAPPSGDNPFASLFQGAGGAGAAPGNPFAALQGMPQPTPEQMQQAMEMLRSGNMNDLFGAGGSGFGAPSQPPAPADTRPPEERYADQLRQLNDMGFFDFDQNVAALRRAGGSVQGAIEQLLS